MDENADDNTNEWNELEKLAKNTNIEYLSDFF